MGIGITSCVLLSCILKHAPRKRSSSLKAENFPCPGEENSPTCWGGKAQLNEVKQCHYDDLPQCVSEFPWGKRHKSLQTYGMSQLFSGQKTIMHPVAQKMRKWLKEEHESHLKSMICFPTSLDTSKIQYHFSSGVQACFSRTRTSGGLTIWVDFWGKITHFPGACLLLWPQKRKFHFIVEMHINMWRVKWHDVWCLFEMTSGWKLLKLGDGCLADSWTEHSSCLALDNPRLGAIPCAMQDV